MIGVEEIDDVVGDEYPANGPQVSPAPKKRGRPKGSGGPSAPKQPPYTEYVLPVSKALIGLSMVAVLVQGNPGWIMATQEADAIAKPVAKLFAKSALARTYGRYIAGSNDYIALALAIGQYGRNAMERSAAYVAMARGSTGTLGASAVSASHKQPSRGSERQPGSGTDSSVNGSNATSPIPVIAADGLPVVTVDLDAFTELTPGRGD